MKIGFSFGRCVNDITEGVVDYNDVLLVIGRTHITDVSQVAPVIDEYIRQRYIQGDRLKAIDIAERLFKEGKLHQPRALGVHPTYVENNEIWMELAPTLNSQNESVKQAYQNYRMLAKLVEGRNPNDVRHLPIRKIDPPSSSSRPLDDNF